MSQLALEAGGDNDADVKFKEIFRSLDFWLLFINGTAKHITNSIEQ